MSLLSSGIGGRGNLNKEQWTVVGLLIVLASLEIIRSGAVQNFFSSFFGQFGVGPVKNSEVLHIPNVGTPASTATAHGVTQQSVKGMPGAGGGHPY